MLANTIKINIVLSRHSFLAQVSHIHYY